MPTPLLQLIHVTDLHVAPENSPAAVARSWLHYIPGLSRKIKEGTSGHDPLALAQEAERALASALAEPEQRLQTLLVKVLLSGRDIDGRSARDWQAGLEDLALAFHRRRADRVRGPLTLPLFIGGGGSASPFYRAALLSAYERRRLERTGIKPYALERVPIPDDLDMAGLPPEHFQRFAVAYGLSIPPEEGPDVSLRPPEPLPREVRARRPVLDYRDKDAV